MEEIVVGIDVGTTKVCTLVGRVEDNKSIRILGVGIEPSEGIRKGIIIDLAAASQAITRSVEKAESTSGLEITSALVSMAGAHVASVMLGPGRELLTSEATHATIASMSRPSSSAIPAETSDTATISAPRVASSLAATEPTLPNPWIAIR